MTGFHYLCGYDFYEQWPNKIEIPQWQFTRWTAQNAIVCTYCDTPYSLILFYFVCFLSQFILLTQTWLSMHPYSTVHFSHSCWTFHLKCTVKKSLSSPLPHALNITMPIIYLLKASVPLYWTPERWCLMWQTPVSIH